MARASKVTEPRLLLDAAELAAELGVSLRQVRRWDGTGLLPRPIRLGSCVRWSRAGIELWIAAGCPDRESWEATNQNGEVRGTG